MHMDLTTRPYPPLDSRAAAVIVGLLDRERLMSIGINRPDGWPQVTTVGYVNEGLDLYFVTGRDSQKLANLAADPRISLSIFIDEQADGPVGLVMSGHAHEVADPDEIQTLTAIMSARWPDFSVYCPTSRAQAVVRFRPEVICLISAVDGQSRNEYFRLAESAAGTAMGRSAFRSHPPSPRASLDDARTRSDMI